MQQCRKRWLNAFVDVFARDIATTIATSVRNSGAIWADIPNGSASFLEGVPYAWFALIEARPTNGTQSNGVTLVVYARYGVATRRDTECTRVTLATVRRS